MITVKASKFAKNFGRYKQAAQREPVEVTSHEERAGYFISPGDFDDFRRLRLSETRKVYRAYEIPREILDGILTSEVHPRHAHLDRLLGPPDREPD